MVRASRSSPNSVPIFTVKLFRCRLEIEIPANSSSNFEPIGYEETWALATMALIKTCGLYDPPSIASALR